MKALINGEDLFYQADLAVEVERIDVTPMQTVEPDMKWTHTDPAGHFHAFSSDSESPLPTLNRLQVEHDHREEENYGDSWLEEYTSIEVVYRCRICEAPVTPQWATRSSTHRVTMPGRLSWRVEARAVGPNAFKLGRMSGQQVSIQVEIEGEMHFGLGLLNTTGATSGEDNAIRWFGCVYGSGPLGHRELTA
jgi:hypothetical protein